MSAQSLVSVEPEPNPAPHMQVSDMMSPAPPLLSGETPFETALALMANEQMSCVLVGELQIPQGIVTERDVIRVFAERGLRAQHSELRLSQIMTPDPICISVNMPVLDALLLARSRRVRHLPVLDDKQHLVGIVSQNDAINAYIRSFDNNLQLLKDNDALRQLSLEDPLLGIGNRRAMNVDLNHMQASAHRYGKPYAIAMFDVDFFKAYNDCYGHQEGDKALKKLADIMLGNIRKSDRIYRYGGEEFLLLMPNTDVYQGYKMAERIRRCVEWENIPHLGSPQQKITVSAGVSSTRSAWQPLVDLADKALYDAKQKGRNQTIKMRF